MQNRELGYMQETQSENVAGSVVFGIIFAGLSSGLSGVAQLTFREEREEERELATMRTRKKRKADFDTLPDAEKVEKILLLEEMAEYHDQNDAEIVRIFNERNAYSEEMDISLMKIVLLG
jgi:hypothetical protein